MKLERTNISPVYGAVPVRLPLITIYTVGTQNRNAMFTRESRLGTFLYVFPGLDIQ